MRALRLHNKERLTAMFRSCAQGWSSRRIVWRWCSHCEYYITWLTTISFLSVTINCHYLYIMTARVLVSGVFNAASKTVVHLLLIKVKIITIKPQGKK